MTSSRYKLDLYKDHFACDINTYPHPPQATRWAPPLEVVRLCVMSPNLGVFFLSDHFLIN